MAIGQWPMAIGHWHGLWPCHMGLRPMSYHDATRHVHATLGLLRKPRVSCPCRVSSRLTCHAMSHSVMPWACFASPCLDLACHVMSLHAKIIQLKMLRIFVGLFGHGSVLRTSRMSTLAYGQWQGLRPCSVANATP